MSARTKGEPVEGVIKFVAEHDEGALDPAPVAGVVADLLAWRDVLFDLGLIGRDPARYGGAGFGNASARVPPYEGPRGRRPFLVTGTQTGGEPRLGLAHLCLVEEWDAPRDRVRSRGPIAPSSESMTHGAVYDADETIRAVLHVHAPEIFRASEALALPTTAAHVEYGTPEMALEVDRLLRETALRSVRVFAMAGHEDGVVSFGRTPEDAGTALVAALARARALDRA